MGHSGAINDLFVLSASRTIVSISSDGTANIWSLTQCQRVPDNYNRTEKPSIITTPTHALAGIGRRITAVAVTPNGKQVVCATADSALKLWDLKSGEMLHSFGGYKTRVNTVLVTPDGYQVLTGAVDGTIIGILAPVSNSVHCDIL
jgi:WD40 repeat protein